MGEAGRNGQRSGVPASRQRTTHRPSSTHPEIRLFPLPPAVFVGTMLYCQREEEAIRKVVPTPDKACKGVNTTPHSEGVTDPCP